MVQKWNKKDARIYLCQQSEEVRIEAVEKVPTLGSWSRCSAWRNAASGGVINSSHVALSTVSSSWDEKKFICF